MMRGVVCGMIEVDLMESSCDAEMVGIIDV